MCLVDGMLKLLKYSFPSSSLTAIYIDIATGYTNISSLYLNNYFRLHVRLSFRPFICHTSIFQIPAVVLENV